MRATSAYPERYPNRDIQAAVSANPRPIVASGQILRMSGSGAAVECETAGGSWAAETVTDGDRMVILQYLIATENTLAGDLLRCCDEGHLRFYYRCLICPLVPSSDRKVCFWLTNGHTDIPRRCPPGTACPDEVSGRTAGLNFFRPPLEPGGSMMRPIIKPLWSTGWSKCDV